MPSTTKTLYFMSSALVSSISVGMMGYGMSTHWAQMTLVCARGGSGLFNGTAVITLDLIYGNLTRTFCPSFEPPEEFEVFSQLIQTGAAPVVLHALAVSLLGLCLLFSACCILISLYNSVSNPYETYMGPAGVYTCSSLSACLSFVVLILFVLNIHVTDIAQDLLKNLIANNIPVDLKRTSSEMQLGYYLVIPYTVLSLLAIALIYMYDHAAYTHRREQQRPTEDAPKEIMMY
ncbi:clarin-3 [Aulostomus maculatus]